MPNRSEIQIPRDLAERIKDELLEAGLKENANPRRAKRLQRLWGELKAAME